MTGLLQLFEFHKAIDNRLSLNNTQIRHLHEAWAVGAHSGTKFSTGKTESVILERDTVLIASEPWGALQLLKVEMQQSHLRKVGFLTQPNKWDSTALWVGDQNSPLAVAGNTNLVGNVVTSQKGIKRGNVGRNGFQGDQLVDGLVTITSKQLPEIAQQIQTEATKLLSLIPVRNLEKPSQALNQTINNSFFNETKLITSDSHILISSNLNGKVLIVAPKITVLSNSQIQDAILVANEINIEERSILVGQLFALHSVTIGADAELQFPSTIFMESTDTSSLHFAPGSLLEGLVIHSTRNPLSTTEISDGAMIHGQLYSMAKTELKGTVYGNAFIQSFYLKTPSTLYRNYLFNATIDRNSRSHYINLSGLKTNLLQSRETIKWLE